MCCAMCDITQSGFLLVALVRVWEMFHISIDLSPIHWLSLVCSNNILETQVNNASHIHKHTCVYGQTRSGWLVR